MHTLTGAPVLSLIHTPYTFLMDKVCMHQAFVFQATKGVGVKLPTSLGESVLERKVHRWLQWQAPSQRHCGLSGWPLGNKNSLWSVASRDTGMR